VASGEVRDADKPALKAAFDALHRQIYGQSAEAEEAEIVTFRVQAEIAIDRFAFPKLAPGAGTVDRARTGERPLYDFARKTFVTAQIYDRAKLAPGDRIAGPAVVNQFDATTVVLDGQSLRVDPFGILVIDVGAAAA
jgi:N-methylhydantoinase A